MGVLGHIRSKAAVLLPKTDQEDLVQNHKAVLLPEIALLHSVWLISLEAMLGTGCFLDLWDFNSHQPLSV